MFQCFRNKPSATVTGGPGLTGMLETSMLALPTAAATALLVIAVIFGGGWVGRLPRLPVVSGLIAPEALDRRFQLGIITGYLVLVGPGALRNAKRVNQRAASFGAVLTSV